MRLLLAILGIISAIFFSPWLTLACALILSMLYPAWEVIIIGALLDFMWMPGLPLAFPICTILALLLVWVFEPIRSQFLNA